MIQNTVFPVWDVFANYGSKEIAKEGGAGYVPTETFPAENANEFWGYSSQVCEDMTAAYASIEAEWQTVEKDAGLQEGQRLGDFFANYIKYKFVQAWNG